MKKSDPMIFVCGPSRSGTALMRSVLNRHPEVHLAPETHYFDDLRTRFSGSGRDVLSAAEADIASDYFRMLTHRPYGQGGEPSKGWLDAEELSDRAASLGGTADAYFLAFCQLSAERADARIAGEKTPRHVFRLSEIASTIPNAQMICMVRDPRAVVASYRDWRNQGGFDFEKDPGQKERIRLDEARARASYHAVTISLLWRAQMRAATRARSDYGPDKVRLVRYEELVRNPSETIESLCGWLGLSYDSEMLKVPMHNSSYSKFSDAQGVSQEALDRWKGKLVSGEVRAVERLCGALMKDLGYSCMAPGEGRLSEARLWASWPVSATRALYANRSRTGNMAGYLARRVRLALGR